MSDDRTVHASCLGFDVVRYDKSGKWFVEPKAAGRKAERVGISEAVNHALAAEKFGGRVFIGKRGGHTFDRLVNAERTP